MVITPEPIMTLKWNLERQKLDKRNKKTSKRLGHGAMSERCDALSFFDLFFFQNLLHVSHTIALSKGSFFCKKKKNGGISKIKEVLLLKGIFSETIYVCVLTYQISSFYHNSNEFQTRSNPPAPSQNKPLKSLL